MGKCQKINAFVITLLFFVVVPSAWAAKNPPVTNAQDPNTAPETRVENLFETVWQSRQPNRAARLLSPAEESAAEAFIKGFSAWQSGRIEMAQKFFREVPQTSGFADYAKYHLAKIEQTQGNAAQALGFVSNKTTRTRRIDWDLFWLKAELLAELRQGAALRNHLKVLTPAEKKDRFVQAYHEYVLGYSDFVAGDREPALRHWTRVLTEYPGYDFDAIILAKAKAAGIADERLLPRPLMTLRAENLIQNGLADWGYELYEQLDDSGEDFTERKALALFRARRYVEAAPYFESLLQNGGSTLDRLSVLVRLSQCYNRTDQFENAQTLYRRIQDEFPNTSQAKVARFNAAQLLLDSGDFAKAAPAFEALLTETKSLLPEQVRNAHWSRFWAYYLDAKWDNAIQAAQASLSDVFAKDESKNAWRYFLARASEQAGYKAQAKAYYQKLILADETDYYALMARQRLQFHKLEPLRLVNSNLLKTWRVVSDSDSDFPEAGTVRAFPVMGKALVLSQLGLEAYAYDELKQLENSAKSNANLASAFTVAGNARIAYAVGFAAKAGRLPNCDFACAAKLRFPQAYSHYVEPFANHWQIEPQLAYAVMRQESAFDPSVVSQAFAYGLMQIIPPTERQIAQEILSTPVSEASLLEPKWNILFGTYYLKQLSSEFGNQLPPTIAAYNAGPYNVSRWLNRKNHKDWDEFVELIPYSETKAYVKKVLVNYWVYSELYP